MRTQLKPKEIISSEVFTLDSETLLLLEQCQLLSGQSADAVVTQAIDAVYRTLREDTEC